MHCALCVCVLTTKLTGVNNVYVQWFNINKTVELKRSHVVRLKWSNILFGYFTDRFLNLVTLYKFSGIIENWSCLWNFIWTKVFNKQKNMRTKLSKRQGWFLVKILLFSTDKIVFTTNYKVRIRHSFFCWFTLHSKMLKIKILIARDENRIIYFF